MNIVTARIGLKEVKPVMILFMLVFVCPSLFGGETAEARQQSDPGRVIVVNGVMLWEETGEEVSLFGINYHTPFSQTYRGLNVMGRDHKEAIDEDIYHFARLGFDAFRTHMYEIEITDSLGNLLQNDHLDLHDYTVYKMSERGIKTILTPTTYYGSGWPDGNVTQPPGFANYISKAQAPVVPEYRPVIKNYLEQLINHRNPYTGLTAAEDPNIIAIEIDNEPLLGTDRETPYPLEDMTAYINELAGHLRENGWDKPIFYNISINLPSKDAVLNADIDGVTMQWYPAGLYDGFEKRSNAMPFVRRYRADDVFNPGGDDQRYHNMAKMVYEFDAADIMHTYAMPMMARSFREAGVQFAAHFSYTALGVAHMNTDWRSHYLNLVYTPGKAVGMLIGSEIFNRVGRREVFNDFPADTSFGEFRLSHVLDLAEMNARDAFLYTNDTETIPVDESSLDRIAGVGTSPVVSYPGTGAYFLDKLEDGVWRLELYPDAIRVRDPFESPDFDKYVTHIDWREHPVEIELTNLGGTFTVTGLNDGNDFRSRAAGGRVTLPPGAYLLTRDGVSGSGWGPESRMGTIEIGEYHAVPPTATDPIVYHEPYELAEAGKPLKITANVAGIRDADSVILRASSLTGGAANLPMSEVSPHRYEAEVPARLMTAGTLRYWIVIEREGVNEYLTFPGGNPSAPWRWNYYHDEEWAARVVDQGKPVELWDAGEDYLRTFPGFGDFSGGVYTSELISSDRPGRMVRQVSSSSPTTHRHELGLSMHIGDRLKGVTSATLDAARELVVRAKSDFENPAPLKVILVDRYGNAYSAPILVDGTLREHRIPLRSLETDRFMLLPRVYTSGMYVPSWGETGAEGPLRNRYIEEIQFLLDTSGIPDYDGEPYGFEVESAWLESGS